jgi:ABC-type lipoprotein release transport system permease subunit
MMGSTAVYLRLGVGNLLLHPARTMLTLLALVIGIAALTFLSAMVDGLMHNMKSNFVLNELGHIQVHAKGFEQTRRIADHIKDSTVVDDLLQQQTAVQAFTHRLRVSGMASAAGSNAMAWISGIEVDGETRVSRLRTFMTQGDWLRADHPRDVVLGSVLAERLELTLGDKVVLMAVGPGGDVFSEVFHLRGILHSGVMDMDATTTLIALPMAQQWLSLGHGVTDVVLRLDDFASVNSVASTLRAGLNPDQFEVLRWMDIDPMAEQWTQFNDAYTWVVLSVVIVVILAEVLNTMLMSMHDRMRELGLMAALGTGRRAMFSMMIWETLLLVAIGGALGFFVGYLFVNHYGVHGIDLSRYSAAFSFMYIEPIIYPVMTWEQNTKILVSALLGAVLAGLYPAWKASRLNPVVAMRE